MYGFDYVSHVWHGSIGVNETADWFDGGDL